MNSREKGKRGEREWAHYLKDNGFEARRGVQYCGFNPASKDKPNEIPADVVCDALPFHWEVKLVESLNVHNAIEQAKRDCPKGKWRAVAHKKNRTGWLITMPVEDFMDLVKEWHQGRVQ